MQGERTAAPKRNTRKGINEEEMNVQKSYFKKALVMLMAVMMVFTMMPSMAWADGEEAAGVGANQGENQAAETFQGTAAHGYVKDISFGDVQFKEEEKIDAAMDYTFDPAQTEYSLTSYS